MSPTPAPAPPRRPDMSMSLLVDVMTHSLDEGYAEQARRHAAGDSLSARPRRSIRGRAVGVAILVVLGVLTGTAIGEVRDRALANAGLRAGLADEVRARSAETERLEQEATDLRAQVTQLRESALDADVVGRQLRERVEALDVVAGTSAVAGPGVVVTLRDGDPDAGEDPELRGGTPPENRVLDRDLQDVVNGLWAAGAEAIAINDVRLSTRSAIRSAGEAILVDFRPLSPPYVVEAIGRPAELEVGFMDGPSGRRLQTLTSFTDITFDIGRAEELTLPAAPEPELRHAAPVGPVAEPAPPRADPSESTVGGPP